MSSNLNQEFDAKTAYDNYTTLYKINNELQSNAQIDKTQSLNYFNELSRNEKAPNVCNDILLNAQCQQEADLIFYFSNLLKNNLRNLFDYYKDKDIKFQDKLENQILEIYKNNQNNQKATREIISAYAYFSLINICGIRHNFFSSLITDVLNNANQEENKKFFILTLMDEFKINVANLSENNSKDLKFIFSSDFELVKTFIKFIWTNFLKDQDPVNYVNSQLYSDFIGALNTSSCIFKASLLTIDNLLENIFKSFNISNNENLQKKIAESFNAMLSCENNLYSMKMFESKINPESIINCLNPKSPNPELLVVTNLINLIGRIITEHSTYKNIALTDEKVVNKFFNIANILLSITENYGYLFLSADNNLGKTLCDISLFFIQYPSLKINQVILILFEHLKDLFYTDCFRVIVNRILGENQEVKNRILNFLNDFLNVSLNKAKLSDQDLASDKIDKYLANTTKDLTHNSYKKNIRQGLNEQIESQEMKNFREYFSYFILNLFEISDILSNSNNLFDHFCKELLRNVENKDLISSENILNIFYSIIPVLVDQNVNIFIYLVNFLIENSVLLSNKRISYLFLYFIFSLKNVIAKQPKIIFNITKILLKESINSCYQLFSYFGLLILISTVPEPSKENSTLGNLNDEDKSNFKAIFDFISSNTMENFTTLPTKVLGYSIDLLYKSYSVCYKLGLYDDSILKIMSEKLLIKGNEFLNTLVNTNINNINDNNEKINMVEKYYDVFIKVFNSIRKLKKEYFSTILNNTLEGTSNSIINDFIIKTSFIINNLQDNKIFDLINLSFKIVIIGLGYYSQNYYNEIEKIIYLILSKNPLIYNTYSLFSTLFKEILQTNNKELITKVKDTGFIFLNNLHSLSLSYSNQNINNNNIAISTDKSNNNSILSDAEIKLKAKECELLSIFFKYDNSFYDILKENGEQAKKVESSLEHLINVYEKIKGDGELHREFFISAINLNEEISKNKWMNIQIIRNQVQYCIRYFLRNFDIIPENLLAGIYKQIFDIFINVNNEGLLATCFCLGLELDSNDDNLKAIVYYFQEFLNYYQTVMVKQTNNIFPKVHELLVCLKLMYLKNDNNYSNFIKQCNSIKKGPNKL